MMNLVDVLILTVLGISVVFGMYRGFISGLLSVAALIGSIALSFTLSGEMAAWLNGNDTLVQTLLYYTDAGSRLGGLDFSMVGASQATETVLNQIREAANLPPAFFQAFVEGISSAEQGATLSQLLSQTIVHVSISILSFLICFAVTYTVATLVIHLVQYVFELPVLRHLDALMGGVFGLARGALLVCILFTLVPIVQAVAPIPQIEELLEASRLAQMFDSRLILSILRGSL